MKKNEMKNSFWIHFKRLPDIFVETFLNHNLFGVHRFTRLLFELPSKDFNRFMIHQKRDDLATG